MEIDLKQPILKKNDTLAERNRALTSRVPWTPSASKPRAFQPCRLTLAVRAIWSLI